MVRIACFRTVPVVHYRSFTNQSYDNEGDKLPTWFSYTILSLQYTKMQLKMCGIQVGLMVTLYY
jgi:hypothetical protein